MTLSSSPQLKQDILISDLMTESGVGFGTSGARGLAEAITDRVCYAYTLAFLQYLQTSGDIQAAGQVAIAGDYRPSTPRIMAAIAKAIQDSGHIAINCGFIPTPAVAYYGLSKAIPAIMVTGSHIPDDRNGIKFYKSSGEILKNDEQMIRISQVPLAAELFDKHGNLRKPNPPGKVSQEARQCYRNRYLNVFPSDCLSTMRIGVYEHSSVARDLMCEILQCLGADIVCLGRSDNFIPVDTEAIRDEDIKLAKQWADQYKLDSIVSTDGDGDRPLISDENGTWLRGDIAGFLCAHMLSAKHIVTPISSNTAVEKVGWFESVHRTRIGSPFVIEKMEKLMAQGYSNIAGYEANGGFLSATVLEWNGQALSPLPTRDAMIVLISVLLMSRRKQQSISDILQHLPARFTASGRLKNFPSEISRTHFQALASENAKQNLAAARELMADILESVSTIDATDGIRIQSEHDEIVHLRPSGNAPELRCYTEADSPERAKALQQQTLALLATWRHTP